MEMQARTCPICTSVAVAKTVDALIAAKESNAGIVSVLREMDVKRVGAVTVQRHRDVCRSSSLAAARYAAGQQKKTDFASLVRDKANELMEAGELAVTTQHGLMAQQMLDARETKEKDRALMMSIARMLAGQTIPDSMIIDVTPIEIEGPVYDADDLEMVGS